MMQTEAGTTTQIPEVTPNEVKQAPEFTGKPGNFAQDMEALRAKAAATAAENGFQPPELTEKSVEPKKVQPETTEKSATAPETVPDKFKNPDGSLNTAKVEQSTVAAKEALDKYLAKEKELRQKMNEVNSLQRQAIQANIVPTSPELSDGPLTPLEIQVANDLIRNAAAYGEKMSQGTAIAQSRVIVRMAEAKTEYEKSITEQLRIKLEDQDRRKELEDIARFDDRVLSPEGFEALSRIRHEKPWINQSPTPWTEAHNYWLAEQTKAARLEGTVLPTPTGTTAKAPPTPVGPTPRVVVQPKDPATMSKDELESHLKGMSPAQEKAFWQARGLRFR